MIGIEIMIAQIAAAAYFAISNANHLDDATGVLLTCFLTFAPRYPPKPLQKSRKPRLPRRSSWRNHRRSHLIPFWKNASSRPSSTNSGRTRNHRSSSTSSVAIILWPQMPRKPISSSVPLPTQRRNDIRLMTKKKVLTTINVKNLAACPPQIFTLHNDYYSQ